MTDFVHRPPALHVYTAFGGGVVVLLLLAVV